MTRPTPLTLKQRVTGFWNWFAENADRFTAIIDAKRCGDLQPKTSAAVDKWLGNMAWTYGPGPNKVGHSLTLSGEGFLPKQLLADYWASQAPALDGWTFYPSRQPSENFGSILLHLEDAQEDFKPIEFWVAPRVDEEEEKIDIAVWHPSIHRLPERTRFMALFLILDELLGEFGTQNWIGEIRFSEDHLARSFPIVELLEFVRETESQQGWKKYPPTGTYTGYSLPRPDSSWLRGDTLAGTTRCFRLVRDFLEAKGPCEHPVPGVGLDYVFVAIPTSHFPVGEEVSARSAIEEEIAELLETNAAGLSLGGATGTANCYLDFALHDGERSLDLIRSVLRQQHLPRQSAIHFFTSDRAGEIIRI